MRYHGYILAALSLTSPAWVGLPPSPAKSVDNSMLIPRVVPDSQVTMEGMSPDWVKTLIMAEFRIETATAQGTFASAAKVLDHYAEMGVNGLWIDPIWQPGARENHWCNYGPCRIDPLLTGAANPEESFSVVKNFVAEAHRRNIRVIFDIVVWGTGTEAPLVSQHPEFYRKRNGRFVQEWGGWAFDWGSPELRAWYQDAAVAFIEKTDADGFRVDLAPDTSGYFFKQVRDALYAKGRKIVIMSEMPGERRNTFDFEEFGVTGWMEEPCWSDRKTLREQKHKFGNHNECLLRSNIVDVVKSGAGIGKAMLQQQGRGGMFRFYTSNLLHHDDERPFVAGNRVRFAYTAIFAPFIPLWWIGEEWDNPLNLLRNRNEFLPWHPSIYFNGTDWSKRDSGPGKALFEDVKRYIRIRRSYPEIFQYFPEHCRDTNIVKLQTTRSGVANSLQAYARYGSGKAVLVVPNYGKEGGDARFQITPDCQAMKLIALNRCKITDLMTGLRLVENAGLARNFTVSIPADHLGVYLVESK